MQPAIFLDRDNTLIPNDGDMGDPEQVRLLDGVASGLARLRDAGYRLVVVTNQGGVARGNYTEDDVDAVHQRIADLVDAAADRQRIIDRFYYCPFHPEAVIEEYRRDHPWRKPRPGMLLQAARDMNLDLNRSWLIGDQHRDVLAGQAAGCRTIHLTRHNGAEEQSTKHSGDGFQRAPSQNGGAATATQPASATATAASFTEAVEFILESTVDHARSASIESLQGPEMRQPPESDASTRSTGDAAGADAGADANADDDLRSELQMLRRVISELSEELRSRRLRRTDFSLWRVAAVLLQLTVLLSGLMALLNLASSDAFLKWIAAALLLQLTAIAVLLFEQHS